MNADLEAVYRDNKRALLAVALNITADRTLAEDAIQNAFQRIIQTSANSQQSKAYLFKAVRNAAIDLCRKRSRQQDRSVPLFENEPLAEQSAEGLAIQNEQQQLIQKVISELAEADREIILLKVFSGFTFEKIGEITSISANTIATRYRRLLEKMKTVLEEKHE